jgi:hypothetical protein
MADVIPSVWAQDQGVRLFDARMDFPAGDRPFSVAIGDLDGDGQMEILYSWVEKGSKRTHPLAHRPRQLPAYRVTRDSNVGFTLRSSTDGRVVLHSRKYRVLNRKTKKAFTVQVHGGFL